MELIKREDVCREIQHSFNLGSFRWQDGQDLMDRINALPTIDAVPVVRCRECKHFNHAIVEINLNSPNKQHHEWDECKLHDITPDPNWFCADGEREPPKEDA